MDEGEDQVQRFQEELAAKEETMLLLAQDLENRVERRTADLRLAQAELQAANEELRCMAEELEERVNLRTQEARRAREAAERATEAKSMFLATMSHEIRTPLNVLLGFCHLASNTAPLSNQQRNYLSQIQTAAHTLMRLVNDNLDLSKIEAGVLDIARIPVRLGPLCQEVIQLVRQKADEKALTFRVEWGPSVPQGLLGDPDRLKQVLLNLVGNAIKFTRRGEVNLRLSMENGGIHFQVQDTGPGLDDNQKECLFTPFSQLHSQRDGSGLGLALSRRLVNLMGGEVGVESAVNEGSTFWFTLPAPPMRTDGRAFPFPTALVVEESESLRNAFAACLRPFVRDVTLLNSIAEAETHVAILNASGAPLPDFIFLPHGAPRFQRRHGVPCHSLIYRVPAQASSMAQKAMDKGWIRDFLVVPTDSARLMDLFLDRRNSTTHPLVQFKDQPRVLLVEDHAVNRMVTTEILERAGLCVEEAANGQQALEVALAPSSRFAAILMDLELPDLDGLEVTRRIRAALGASPPILALTAHTLQSEKERCAEAGMDGFLSKPLEPQALYRSLLRFLPAWNPSTLQGVRPPLSNLPISIDWNILQNRVMGNEDLARRVLAQFRREVTTIRADLRAAMEAGDMAALMATAHTLAGAAANIGAEPVYQASRRLHHSPSTQNLRILEQALGGLMDELASADAADTIPTHPVSTGLEPADVVRMKHLLARNSLEALNYLPSFVEALIRRGRQDLASALQAALEGLNFAEARLLVDAMDPSAVGLFIDLRRTVCSGAPPS